MSQLRQLASDTLIYGMSVVLPKIIHVVVFTFYLINRFDDTADFGVYNDLYAYAAILLVVLTFRMETAYFRFASRSDDVHQVFSTVMLYLMAAVGIALAGIVFFSDQIAFALGYGDRSIYVIWFAFILAFDALMAVPFARLRLDSRPLRFLMYKLINVVIPVVLIIFFLEVLPGLNLDVYWSWLERPYLVDYAFIANLIASALVFLLMLPEWRGIRLSLDTRLIRSMLGYSLPLVIVSVAGNFNQYFAVPLQKWYLGDDVMSNLANGGVYAASAKLALLLNLFIVAFNYAAEPFFFRQFSDQSTKHIYGQVALAFSILTGFMVLAIYIYLPIILPLIPEPYQAALPVVPYLLMAYFFLGLYYNISIWYKLIDRTIVGAGIAVIGALITFVVSTVYLPSVGTIGSAYAALACYGIMLVLAYLTGQYFYPIDYPIARILCYTILTAALLVFCAVAQWSFVANQIVLLSYIAVVWILDRKFLRELILS